MEENIILEGIDEQISRLFTEIKSLEPGSEGYAAALEDLKRLEELRSKEIDAFNSIEKISVEKRERKKDRICRFLTDAAGIVLPLAVFGAWNKKGFKFEETGVYTSQTFREMRNNMYKFFKR